MTVREYWPLLVALVSLVAWFARLEASIKTNKLIASNKSGMINLRLDNLSDKTESESKILFEKTTHFAEISAEIQKSLAVISESIKHIEQDIKRNRDV